MDSSSMDENKHLQTGIDKDTELVLDEEHNIKVPVSIAQHLKEYQKDGVIFLYRKFKKNKGSILADEMEDGKAVQVIALLAALLKKTGDEGDRQYCVPQCVLKEWESQVETRQRLVFLLVAPANLLNGWAHDFKTRRFFIVEKLSKTERNSLLNKAESKTVEIVLCPMESFRYHVSALTTVQWDGLIVDEIQKINNSTSQLNKTLRQITCKRRIGLMRSLAQSMLEMWNILDWANPGIFGTKLNFVKKWERPIELGERADADEQQQSVAKKRRADFSRRRRCCMLKRTKTRNQAKRTEQVIYCQMGSRQQQIYEQILNSKETQLVLKKGGKCSCQSEISQYSCCLKKDGDARTKKQLKFSLLQLLRKTCNHVGLLDCGYRSRSYDLLSSILQQQRLSPSHLKCRNTDPKFCGKMQVLEKLLQRFSAERSKVLLFSSSARILDFLESLVKDGGYKYLRLDGSTPVTERSSLVSYFNEDESIFVLLISIKLSVRHLNITSANRVVVFEPMWDPSGDQQAHETAYTTDQQQNMEVYRLITSGTIEECIYLRQLHKQKAKIGASGEWSDKSMKDELFGWKNLFSFKPGLTKSLLEQQEKAERSLLEDHDSFSYEEGERDMYDPSGQMQGDLKNIFRSSGVSHTHEHQAVVAKPRKLSKVRKQVLEREKLTNPGSASGLVDDQCAFYGQTPVKEMMRQFREIAHHQRISETELSCRVLAATDEERLDLLRDFYGPQFPH